MRRKEEVKNLRKRDVAKLKKDLAGLYILLQEKLAEKAAAKLKNIREISQLKKKIARFQTVLKEKDILKVFEEVKNG